MPKWGLTRAQRYTSPWNLPAGLLGPAKTITDPVHGDIYVTELERLFIDSPPLQRLRRVRQLGTSHYVYPGATHTRFSHSLGALRVAQDLLDAVIDVRNGPRPTRDLFDEWDGQPTEVTVTPEGEEIHFSEYDKKLAEVTVLARLGALLHDLCHVPFGHTIEDDLQILEQHDVNTARFDRFWSQLDSRALEAVSLSNGRLLEQLRPLILSKTKTGAGDVVARDIDELEYPFVADIVGNTICADLIDYLERDHIHTGLPVALGHRFANDFYVAPTSEVHFRQRMVIRITRDGHERPDVVTELLKFLRYRYELSERVLVHHAKTAADAMIGKLLEMWHDSMWTLGAASKFGPLSPELQKDIDLLRAHVAAADPDAPAAIDQEVVAHLEERFTSRSDDGLLEELTQWGLANPDDKRDKAVRSLAASVLDRRFFKEIGRAESSHDRGLKERLFKEFGTRTKRRELEALAARCVGLTHSWAVVMWLPAPKMRLKVAEVLVDDNGKVNALDKVGNKRAEEIYGSHESLWGVSVYADPTSVGDLWARRAVLSYLGGRLGIRFHDRSGREIPPLRELAADHVSAEHELPVAKVVALKQKLRDHAIAAHGAAVDVTFAELIQQVEALAQSEGLLGESLEKEGTADEAPGTDGEPSS